MAALSNEELLERALSFRYRPGVEELRRLSIEKRSTGWAVFDGFSYVFTQEKKWEYERSPSNREEDWKAKAYWPSIQAAFDAADEAVRMEYGDKFNT